MAEPLERPVSRPLSEISENEDRRRVSTRLSTYSNSVKGVDAKPSRPTSEVRDLAQEKRLSSTTMTATSLSHTITVNLADYTGVSASSYKNALVSGSALASSSTAAPSSPLSPLSQSPSSKAIAPPAKPEKPAELVSRPLSTGSIEAQAGHDQDSQPSKDGISPLLMAKRASLRPSPLGGAIAAAGVSYADVVKPSPSPLPAPTVVVEGPPSSIDTAKPPPTRSKPSWLKRASIAPGLRNKTRSPATSDTELPPVSPAPPLVSSVPPALPPRKEAMITTTTAGSLLDRASGSMLPPDSHTSYANIAAGSLASRSLAPPQHPGNIRSRLAAWTAGSGGGVQTPTTSSTFVRSQSSFSLLTPTAPSGNSSQQRATSSAQRVLGHAGSAVSKTWMRARGVGSSMSISNMGALAQVRSNESEISSAGVSIIGSSLSRKRSQEPFRADIDFTPAEGPVFAEGVVKRKSREGQAPGRVFGREVEVAGRSWGVFDAAVKRDGEEEYSQRRRQCLPAVVVRSVDYLQQWGPKEEGIFRISGRSSHIARLRKEFDAGADLDLTLCDPGDLDPHAVAGIFKSYLRELPSPLLTTPLEPEFEALLRSRTSDGPQKLVELVSQLPSAHWFLLSDVVKLIDLIPRHADINRMSHNALMISLGPTLRLSGDMLDLFLRHRDVLFTTPPPMSNSESALDLIDFGDTDEIIPPLTPSPLLDASSFPPSLLTRKTAPPRLPKKPSLGRLLGGSRKNSNEGSPPRASIDLPRVGLPQPIMVPMPPMDLTEELESPTSSPPSVPAKFTERIEDVHYAAGTVESRTRAFSTPTPIADRFKGTSTVDTALRTPKSSTGSMSSSGSASIRNLVELAASANPIAMLRRSPPTFFQSVNSERHSLALSTSSAKTTLTAAGVKRKDETGDDDSTSRAGDDADGAGASARVKRLSAGLAPNTVRDAITAMEEGM